MPDNSGYYHLAYVLAAVIYGLYAVTLYLRRKRLRDHDRSNDTG
ncbi:MAG TPA: hypothetical protein VNC11_04560 [Gemmatimonadaceae bacterium]|jgi:hypothetical protein|nr:hypothetical protein [Gemmatimonadaceae bacterium]